MEWIIFDRDAGHSATNMRAFVTAASSICESLNRAAGRNRYGIAHQPDRDDSSVFHLASFNLGTGRTEQQTASPMTASECKTMLSKFNRDERCAFYIHKAGTAQ